jgi:hypothetical protein
VLSGLMDGLKPGMNVLGMVFNAQFLTPESRYLASD